MNVQHSSARASWGTPSVIVEFARRVLGRIDVDPFTSDEWNRTVKATHIHTEQSDGFASPWVEHWPSPGDVLGGEARPALDGMSALVNPPGDARGVNARRAWSIAGRYYERGYLSGGVIWVCFNLGQLRTLQNDTIRSPLHPDFLRLIPRRRIPYDEAPGVASKSPSHDSVFVLMPAEGKREDGRTQRSVFRDLGAAFGEVF